MEFRTYNERVKRGDVSSIKVDNHIIVIAQDNYGNRLWFVCYTCMAHMDSYDLFTRHDSLSKAKKKAFELSNTKCTFCYDEHGVRRRRE